MPSAPRCAGLALAGVLLLASAGRGDGPLALHSPPLVVPPEVAGLGLAPEVAVKLAIDERGAVTKVEVGSISPSSEHDAHFRDAAVHTFSRWRFAPGTRDGRPVPSTLEWKVKFPALEATPEAFAAAVAPLAGADAEQRRAAVLALPDVQRRAMLEAETRRARALLDPAKTREATSPRFIVQSDADEERAAKAVADNLEVVFNVLAQELLPGIRLQAEPYKVQVVVYRSRAQFRTFASTQSHLEGAEALYSPAGLIVIHTEMPTSDDLLNGLLHEATHAFLDRHVVRTGVALPRWLGEGFAEYVGNSAIERGRLKPGKTVVHKYAMARNRVVGFDTGAGLRLDEAKIALRRGSGIGLDAMLAASPEIFYGERSHLFYATAWLLVHYLRDGTEGWAAERFPTFLLYVAEGYPQEAAFRTLYGDPAAADQAFRQYVKGF